MTTSPEIEATRTWIEKVVIGLNLCPFAKREIANERVRFTLSNANTEEDLLLQLLDEFNTLASQLDIETSLLIHPHVLDDFYNYNEFLHTANALLAEQGFEGVFQLASFHPNYQFADVSKDDASNYTNRSPYPMLHILREESLSKAIDAFPDVEGIPARNVALTQEIGAEKLRGLLRACLRS